MSKYEWQNVHTRHGEGRWVFSLAWVWYGEGEATYTIGLGKWSFHFARRLATPRAGRAR